MSGIDEILPWAIKEFPPDDYETFEEWYGTIDLNFADNNRLPLDAILGDEKDIMEQYWHDHKAGLHTHDIPQDFIDDQRGR